jgi:2-methylisocitrate lyase-like PEP mutase family enzyme
MLPGELSLNASTRLRQMLARPGIVVAPGICDGISARAALEAGFNCLYQSGAATTASRLGMPDLAIATLNDFVQVHNHYLMINGTLLTSMPSGWLHGRVT